MPQGFIVGQQRSTDESFDDGSSWAQRWWRGCPCLIAQAELAGDLRWNSLRGTGVVQCVPVGKSDRVPGAKTWDLELRDA